MNYARPNFFGRFAFDFVETFLNDLDLYVIDPQAATEKPIKRTKNAFFDTWFKANENTRNYFLKENSDDLYFYLPQSDAFYEYNLNKKVLETKLRRAYCVPKWYVFRRKTDGQVITLAAWVEHLPTVFPPADYFLLIKKQRKNGIGLISAETFSLRFGHFLTNFETTNCKIIHPAQAKAAKMIFETTVFEHDLEEFAERVPIEKCF